MCMVDISPRLLPTIHCPDRCHLHRVHARSRDRIQYRCTGSNIGLPLHSSFALLNSASTPTAFTAAPAAYSAKSSAAFSPSSLSLFFQT